MSEDVPENMVQEIAQGFFDGLALASGTQAAAISIVSGEKPTAQALEAFVEEPAVLVQGLAGPYGAVTMVMRQADLAAYLGAAGMGDDAEPGSPIVRELLQSALGGAVDYVRQLGDSDLELGEVSIVAADSDSIAALMDSAGAQAAGGKAIFEVRDAPAGESWLILDDGVRRLLTSEPASDNGGAEPRAQHQQEYTMTGQQADAGAQDAANLDIILDIQLVATARLGGVEMPLQDILSLGPGSIIEIGHGVDEPVELLINGKLIARGDVVVVNERFGLRITEIVSQQERVESLR